MGKEKGDNPLPENQSVDPDNIVTTGWELENGNYLWR